MSQSTESFQRTTLKTTLELFFCCIIHRIAGFIHYKYRRVTQRYHEQLQCCR
jgi:hypothetical protein